MYDVCSEVGRPSVLHGAGSDGKEFAISALWNSICYGKSCGNHFNQTCSTAGSMKVSKLMSKQQNIVHDRFATAIAVALAPQTYDTSFPCLLARA